MNRSRTVTPRARTLSAGERWRTLAEAAADDFALGEGDTIPARVADTLVQLFGGAALVLDGVGDDAAVFVRGPSGGSPPAAVTASAVAMARAAARAHRIVREDAAGGHTIAAPLTGRRGAIGALAVRSAGLSPAEAAALLECLSVHAARVLDARVSALELAEPSLDVVESERRHAIGELAAGVAHHLNNLMTVALGNVQLVMRQRAPERNTRSLGAIERAVLDAADVVRRLAASSGGPPVGAPTRLDLNALVADTLALSRARWHDEAQVRGVAIQATFEPGEIPHVVADETEVRELLLNLVLNALDALDAGGEFVVRTWAERERVLCTVADTGEGMPPEVRRRATEPFFSTRGPGRRGLGLSVARGIVERHRGLLIIDSRAGEGTNVTFSLPACPAPRPEAPNAVPFATRGLRVLIVDDEDAVRSTIADLLTAAGHEPREAASGEDALALLAIGRGNVDLVLTDLGMPGLTGWDIIERVKARWPELPVVLVTGWGEHPRGGDGRHAPDAVLAKPITDERLREVIASVVGVTV
jgi:signal transduction histidine kinase